MAKKIFKYPLFTKSDSQTQTLHLPIGAEILHCTIDQSTAAPAIWCKIDIENIKNTEERHFRLILTGELIKDDENLKHINTIHRMYGWGIEVHHMFEVLC